jgi:hypothetical protein
VSAPRSPGVRGRPFEKRNPGQKPGSKNKASLIAAALIDGELPELLRTAIEIAKGGILHHQRC